MPRKWPSVRRVPPPSSPASTTGCTTTAPALPPKSALGEVLAYIARYSKGFGRFLTHGRVEFDSNPVERTTYMSFPSEHWTQIARTNATERVIREIKRRADVIGIFPNDEAIIRLVGALMPETNDDWAVARRFMSLETLARVTDDPTVRRPAVAA